LAATPLRAIQSIIRFISVSVSSWLKRGAVPAARALLLSFQALGGLCLLIGVHFFRGKNEPKNSLAWKTTGQAAGAPRRWHSSKLARTARSNMEECRPLCSE
jgi:hypothetical protein